MSKVNKQDEATEFLCNLHETLKNEENLKGLLSYNILEILVMGPDEGFEHYNKILDSLNSAIEGEKYGQN
jgi:hypothetical protein